MKAPPSKDGLWSFARVARYLDLCEETVRRMARRGDIKGNKSRGRMWGFREYDVRRYQEHGAMSR